MICAAKKTCGRLWLRRKPRRHSRWEHDVEEELKPRFWDKWPDGMVLDKEDKICYVIEFKRAFERYGGAQEEQNDSMTTWFGG